MAHRDVLSQLSILILVGKQKSSAVGEAQRLHAAFQRFHRDPAKPEDRDLFYRKIETSLQGTKMLGVKGLKVEGLAADVKGPVVDLLIAEFINLRLVKQNYPWRDRTP